MKKKQATGSKSVTAALATLVLTFGLIATVYLVQNPKEEELAEAGRLATYTAHLDEGYNYISAVVNGRIYAETVCENPDIMVVTRHSPRDFTTLEVYRCDGVNDGVANFRLKPQHAYYVRARERTTLTFEGGIINNYKHVVREGANPFAFPDADEAGLMASDLCGSYPNAVIRGNNLAVTAVSLNPRYINGAGSSRYVCEEYHPELAPFSADDFRLETGLGYDVYAEIL